MSIFAARGSTLERISRGRTDRHGMFLAVLVGLFSAVVAALNGPAGAQATSITGHVSDGVGQSLPGVSVTAIPETGGVASRAISDEHGAYQFGVLPDGTYRVDFELLGFDLARVNHVRVRDATAAKADAALAVSPICECIEVLSPAPLRERSGQVVDESGWPLPHARLEVVAPLRRDVAYADSEGRFQVRLPIDDRWPLAVSDGGFGAEAQQVSATGSGPLIYRLAHTSTVGLPDQQRLARRCRCPGDLFTHAGR